MTMVVRGSSTCDERPRQPLYTKEPMVKLKVSLVSIIPVFFALQCFAEDSLNTVNFNSAKLFSVNNLWLNSGNASGLVFNLKNELTTFDAGALFKNGNFHTIREAEQVDQLFFSTSSYRSVTDRFFVSGKFSYNNADELGARWTGTYDPGRGNPYQLADSLTGVNTHKENFRLSGQAAWAKSDRLILGCGIDYFVAVAAKQKDPRPEITVTFLELNPSVLLVSDKYRIGIDAGYNNRKEEISYTTYKNNFNPVFFMFKGFGFHSKEIDYGFYRFQTAREGFGGIQYDRSFSGLSSFTEIRGKYSFEKIEDGGSVIIREDGGDWKTWQINFSEKLKWESGKNIHLLTGNFDFFNGDGIEYIQDVIFVGNNEEYVTVSKNLKFNRILADGKIGYNFIHMKEAKKIDWDIKAVLEGGNSNEKYYYVPEVFSSSYINLTGNLGIQKNVYTGNFHFALSVNGGYTSNLSNSIFLSNLPEITKSQRLEIYTAEFEFLTSDLLVFKGLLQAGYSFGSGRKSQVNLSLSADYLKPVNQTDNSLINCLKLGFVF